MKVYEKIKSSTVAFALLKEDIQEPFIIIGSGFCIHPRGIIVTCEHVFSAFMSKTVPELVAKLPIDSKSRIPINDDIQILSPHILFFKALHNKLMVFPVPIDVAMIKTDCDIGIVRLLKHTAFPEGYPSLDIEDYSQIYEGMEVATCGFPLGNYLGKQIGTMTSSFTKGIISSIIPYHGCPLNLIKGFQLNLTATYGNSGGPVFAPNTGKVFGILQGGVLNQNGDILPGLTKAEPIYPLFSDYNFLKDIVSAPETSEGIQKWVNREGP